MTVLIIGVPDSGKSVKAEEIAMKLSGDDKRIYIATMIPFGEAGKKRVEKHRRLRAGKGFETIECPTKVGKIPEKYREIKGATCLLECMSNLVGNEMHLAENKDLTDKELTDNILNQVLALKNNAKNLVIVSNSFPLEGEGYDEDTKRYTALTNMVNAELKKIADEIHEYVDERWT